jgi:hypothetical protein
MQEAKHHMKRNDLAEELLAGLLALEQNGNLVITHTSPQELADELCSKVIQKWAREFMDSPPSEVVIANGVEAASRYLTTVFTISGTEARLAVEGFISQLRQTRPLGMVAELVAHQGPEDVALGAYYCVHLQRGEYYDSGFLEWRKEVYASAQSR